jgi:hypothetical protein
MLGAVVMAVERKDTCVGIALFMIVAARETLAAEMTSLRGGLSNDRQSKDREAEYASVHWLSSLSFDSSMFAALPVPCPLR